MCKYLFFLAGWLFCVPAHAAQSTISATVQSIATITDNGQACFDGACEWVILRDDAYWKDF